VPISPVTVVAPVLVIPAPARMAKSAAVPSGTAVAAASALLANVNAASVETRNKRTAGAAAARTRVMRDLLREIFASSEGFA
jgi:tetrahydromethanopterin S-methyltransferase subunit D